MGNCEDILFKKDLQTIIFKVILLLKTLDFFKQPSFFLLSCLFTLTLKYIRHRIFASNEHDALKSFIFCFFTWRELNRCISLKTPGERLIK